MTTAANVCFVGHHDMYLHPHPALQSLINRTPPLVMAWSNPKIVKLVQPEGVALAARLYDDALMRGKSEDMVQAERLHANVLMLGNMRGMACEDDLFVYKCQRAVIRWSLASAMCACGCLGTDSAKCSGAHRVPEQAIGITRTSTHGNLKRFNACMKFV
eukprot:scaffold96513_cov22-Tisochrysis_lutea.AAC.1